MELYHIVNRGVEQRDIFLDHQDYMRFVYDLFEFNDQNMVDPNTRFFTPPYDIEGHAARHSKRLLLVDLHAFCLMSNHYHLFVSSRVERGVPQFMKKLNMGYAKYFNERYDRSGALFQGRYRRCLVQRDAHFAHLPLYIHLNPLDLVAPEWRQGNVQNPRRAIEYLERYRWSSLRDYLGERNFPSVITRDFLTDVVGKAREHRRNMSQWIRREINGNVMSGLLLE